EENIPALIEGASNLKKQVENAKIFGIPCVVAINKFTTDTEKEIEKVKELAIEFGADDVAISEVWEKGGEGGLELAEKVIKASEKEKNFQFLYPLDIPIKKKIEIIATKIYGAERVEYTSLAEEKIKLYTKWGFQDLPICMAKTHLSLSHDPNLKGAPEGFTLPIRDVRISAGAGFLYPLCGEMRTMPGLPSEPAGTKVDIDEEGKVVGLF
ncbi:MAG: formate--tetrahydrofolate ligase, partial [Candidatus Ratteibacteria bacterium]